MSWDIGYDEDWRRDIGYGVPAYCDHPSCGEIIDRGLSYVCGDEPYGGDKGCGLYFCTKHQVGPYQRCARCARYRKDKFTPKPDLPRWIHHKLTDESWAQWRDENPMEVDYLRQHLAGLWGEERVRLLTELRTGVAEKDWQAWAEEAATILEAA